MTAIKNVSNSEKADVAFDAWKLLTRDKTQLVQLTLNPGESIADHVNEQDVFFYLLLGSGDLTVEGEPLRLEKNDSVWIEKGKSRSLHNPGTEPLGMLVFKFM